jgi:AmmeMemoRadiSam system protein A
MLTEKHGQILLRLARQTLEEQLGLQPSAPLPPEELTDPVLKQHRGIFVTLNKDGHLRGCIGSLLGVESLLDGVRRHVVNAALHDQRFPMVSADEVKELEIDISVLTPPQELVFTDGNDLLDKLRPQKDGVILKSGTDHAATFLPQVWKQLPLPELFLDHLCLKAGLSGGCWRFGDITIQTYQAQYFTENTTR